MQAQSHQPRPKQLARTYLAILNLFLIVLLLAACTTATPTTVEQPTPATPAPGQPPTSVSSEDHLPQAEVAFVVGLSVPLGEGQNLYVEILDEVTGLALNPTRIKLEAVDPLKYSTTAMLPLHSVVKYRYIRDNDPVGPIEYTTMGQQVRYRLFYVDGPGTAFDVISAWRNVPSTADLGRIQGQVSGIGSNAPVVNALVVAGGVQTLTASDGTFLLEGLPPGTHNMVVYTLDGEYQIFQQGAVVAPNSTTPAFIQVAQSNYVNVTFIVTPPANNLKGVPVRLIGNLYSLGNTFADLRGGVSVVSSRAPIMTVLPDGRYTLTLHLPMGLDLRYKYTLGDGFWNAEHRSDGAFRTRQLIVPDRDTTIEESIDAWTVNNIDPVSFTVTLPADTPVTDVISIQFNPYGWTEPLPMWPMGNNKWFYILYSPLHLIKNASYRYCRNEQCGFADAEDTKGINGTGKTFSGDNGQKKIDDTVPSWAWMGSTGGPITVSGEEILPREGFVAAGEFVPSYHPGWQPYLPWAFQNLRDIGANTVILSPTWHWTRQNPPVIEPVTGQDPLWADLSGMVNQANQRGVEVMVHPVGSYMGQPSDWWNGAARDDGWWQSWFDRYHTFMVYHADFASQSGAKALVIGDENLLPALPGGTLADGTPSGVPGDAAERWQQMISDIRGRFKGRLIWMIPVTGAGALPAPAFLEKVDALYVRVSAPLSNAGEPTVKDLEAGLANILDEQVLPVQKATNQTIWLGLYYPSALGAEKGCVPFGNGCLTPRDLESPALAVDGVTSNYQVQANIYSAALSNLNQRSWITGLVSSGYYPAVALRDVSVSVRSKPAADVLWYWFPRLRGNGP